MLNIYIVEDMAITRASLEDNLLENGYQIAGSKASAEKAWEEIKNLDNLDIVLLDIHLAEEKSGIWLAQQIRAHLNLPFIYLTAFGDDQTLKEVVDTKANGYLMKPYNLPTLLTTITIAIESFADQENTSGKGDDDASISLGSTIYIKDSHIRVKLSVNEILYIQSDGNYLHIFLEHKRHVIRSKMTDFSKNLRSDLFKRVHQRYMVNVSKIDQIGAEHISIGNTDIPLKGKYKAELLQHLNLN